MKTQKNSVAYHKLCWKLLAFLFIINPQFMILCNSSKNVSPHFLKVRFSSIVKKVQKSESKKTKESSPSKLKVDIYFLLSSVEL